MEEGVEDRAGMVEGTEEETVVEEGIDDGTVVEEGTDEGTCVVEGVDDVAVTVPDGGTVCDEIAVVDSSLVRLCSSRCICFCGLVGAPFTGNGVIFPVIY